MHQNPANLDQENLSIVSGWSNTLKPKSMPSALAVFTCRPNSHPFQERHVYLDEPVKIGRSVARCRPAQNNATFDCKVLSRNHALVWFDHKTGKVRRLLLVFSVTKLTLECFFLMKICYLLLSWGFCPWFLIVIWTNAEV